MESLEVHEMLGSHQATVCFMRRVVKEIMEGSVCWNLTKPVLLDVDIQNSRSCTLIGTTTSCAPDTSHIRQCLLLLPSSNQSNPV